MALIRNIFFVLLVYAAAWFLHTSNDDIDKECHAELGDCNARFDTCEYALQVCLERP